MEPTEAKEATQGSLGQVEGREVMLCKVPQSCKTSINKSNNQVRKVGTRRMNIVNFCNGKRPGKAGNPLPRRMKPANTVGKEQNPCRMIKRRRTNAVTGRAPPRTFDSHAPGGHMNADQNQAETNAGEQNVC